MNHCIKGKGKRMTALLLVLVLALSMISTTAFAAQEDNYPGFCPIDRLMSRADTPFSPRNFAKRREKSFSVILESPPLVTF